MASSMWGKCSVLTINSSQPEILIFLFSSTACMTRRLTCFLFMANHSLVSWVTEVRCNKMGKWSDGLINMETSRLVFSRSWRKCFKWWRQTLKRRFCWSACECIMENFSIVMTAGWNQANSLSLTIPMSWTITTLARKIWIRSSSLHCVKINQSISILSHPRCP